MTFFDIFFKVQFIVSLIIAMLIFCIYCPRRRHFAVRLILSCAAAVVVSTLLWDLAKKSAVGSSRYLGIIACNIFYIAELVGICLLCFRCSLIEMCIYVVGGWVMQHLSGTISSITAKLIGIEVNYIDYTWKYFLITVLSYADVYFVVWLLFSRIRRNSTLIISKRILIPSLIMLGVMIFLNIYMPYDLSKRGFIVMRLYAVSACVVMLFLIFSAFKEGNLKYDLDVVKQLERQRSEQYEMSRESIDVINDKCHDLKKLLGIITADRSALSEAELAEITAELERYDAIVKTGNKVLDTILTEKSLYCSKNGIRLSVVADAEAIGFMSDIDVYSLFANLLDNAIEAVSALDEQKRMIELTVRRVNGFLSVHAENCYEGELSMKNGLPLTTKDDKNRHGFGTLSIRHTAKKYGGDVAVTAEDGIFSVDIIVPLDDKKAIG